MLAATVQAQEFAHTSEDMVRGLSLHQDTGTRGISKGLDLSQAPVARREVVSLRETAKGVVLRRGFEVVEREAGFVNLKVEFDVNSAHLRPEARQLLAELAQALTTPELKDHNFGINGHTDADGDDDYNLRLSLARARSVRRYLASQYGVPESRLVVAGYGESMPIASNTTRTGKQLNRRVEIERLQ